MCGPIRGSDKNKEAEELGRRGEHEEGDMTQEACVKGEGREGGGGVKRGLGRGGGKREGGSRRERTVRNWRGAV